MKKKNFFSQQSLAGLKKRTATMKLRYGSYNRQQWGILDNERKFDPAK